MKNPKDFFLKPIVRKQCLYEALRMSFVDGCKDREVCEEFNLKYNTFRSLKRDFLEHCQEPEEFARNFFTEAKVGKREKKITETEDKIIQLRKCNTSVSDIKAILSSQGIHISLWKIDKLLKENDFAPLHRRTNEEKQKITLPEVFHPEEAQEIEFLAEEQFESLYGSIFLFCPIIKQLQLDTLVEYAGYPQTGQIGRLSAILSFLALKVNNTKRLSHSNDYALDRGLGLFCRLNVLPKNAWFASYSYRVTRSMNQKFLTALHQRVEEIIPGSGDINLDFTTIPHWGDQSVLERNWSGKRRVGLKSVLALLAQDQNNRLLKYSNAEIKHARQAEAILEFVDFYRSNGGKISCLIFDSKFTTYQHLQALNRDGIHFITLRRRSTNMITQVSRLAPDAWTRIQLSKKYKRKHRQLWLHEELITLKDYEGELRQIIIRSEARAHPSFLITNDFDNNTKDLVLKYAKRWLIEQSIAEQIDFYHLNRLNSSIVVKVDFDLTMSLLADTVIRLFANQIAGFEQVKAETIYRLFIKNYSRFQISNTDNSITITLNKKVHLPLLAETDWFLKPVSIPWLGKYKVIFKLGSSL